MLVLAALFVGGAGFELGVGIGVRTLYPVVKGLALAAAVLTVQWLTLGALASSGVGGALDMPLALAGTLVGFRKGRSPRWRRTTRGGRGGASWVWGNDAKAIGMGRPSSYSSDGQVVSYDSDSGGGSDSGSSSDSFGGGQSGGGGASGSY